MSTQQFQSIKSSAIPSVRATLFLIIQGATKAESEQSKSTEKETK
jgi:hypothetical protein